MRQTGEAMILTSVVLIAGFSLLTLSDFGATFNVGLLTSLTIAFALIADLLLLPVLLRYFLPQKSVLHLIRTNKKGH
jgi:predicted RND superfamily exporter protein